MPEEDYYLVLTLTKSEEHVLLPRPVRLSGGRAAELGIVDFKGPEYFGNVFSNRDFIKASLFRAYTARNITIASREGVEQKLNALFDKHGYESKITYSGDNNCFTAEINSKYFILLSDAFAKQLGLPSKLIGTIQGAPVAAATAAVQQETIRFYDSRSIKHVFRVKSGYYESVDELLEAFAETAGIRIDSTGTLLDQTVKLKHLSYRVGSVYISTSLREKLLRWDFAATFSSPFMLFSNAVEACHVGDQYLPLVSLIPPPSWQRGRLIIPGFTRQWIQYKTVIPVAELVSLHLKLTDGDLRPVQFYGPIYVTVHIRS